jgi:hypothetical protein
VAAVFLTLSEVAALKQALDYHNEGHAFGRIATMTLVFTFFGLGWCVQAVKTWRSLFDAEESLTLEKEASDAILTAVCDATFCLSEDGDTIRTTSAKLEAILGRELEGKVSATSWLRASAHASKLSSKLEGYRKQGLRAFAH